MSRRSALATIAAGVAAALLTSACPIESTYLDEIEDQIYRDLGPPADPSGLTATALDADRIDLSWSDNADVEQAFEVERKRSAVGEFERIATLSPDSTSYRDTDLDSQTTYFYQVRAVNAGGATVWLSADATTHQLAAPIALTVSALDETRIDVAWTDECSWEEGFELQRADGPGGDWITVYPSLAPGTESIAETALASGTGFAYRVRAIDGGGASEWSNEAAAITAYEIGDMGPAGGTVFFDDADDGVSDEHRSWRYMELAPESTQWTTLAWGQTWDYLWDRAVYTFANIGEGQDNTETLYGVIDESFAAPQCWLMSTTRPHEFGIDADDWFLPSFWELNEVYLQRDALPEDLLQTAYYSSTEYSEGEAEALDAITGNRVYPRKSNVSNSYV
ncbi:MAG: fibronectin type III domain-containing protein, partial [Spirochaetota bacterium]